MCAHISGTRLLRGGGWEGGGGRLSLRATHFIGQTHCEPMSCLLSSRRPPVPMSSMSGKARLPDRLLPSAAPTQQQQSPNRPIHRTNPDMPESHPRTVASQTLPNGCLHVPVPYRHSPGRSPSLRGSASSAACRRSLAPRRHPDATKPLTLGTHGAGDVRWLWVNRLLCASLPSIEAAVLGTPRRSKKRPVFLARQ